MGRIWTFIWALILPANQLSLIHASPFELGGGGDEEGRGVRKDVLKEYSENSCGYYYNMEQASPFKFQSPSFGVGNYPPGVDCTWSFIGTGKCTPEISCDDLDLRKNSCEDKIVISDGIGGRSEVCGDSKFRISRGFRATNGTRDLYVRFVSSKNSNFKRRYGGFQCTVKCADINIRSAAKLNESRKNSRKEEPCTCGVHNEESRVVHGQNADRNEFPWQVAFVNPGTRQPFCGGSIINNQYILTAAHCFYFSKKKPHEVEVLVHAHILDFTVTSSKASFNAKPGEEGFVKAPGHNFKMLTDEEDQSTRFKVASIMMHPLFTEKFDFDAALVKLDGQIDFGKIRVAPICLPEPGEYQSFEDTVPTVSGWGLGGEKYGASTRLLQKLQVPVIPLQTCQQAMPKHVVSDRMLCAGFLEGGSDACTGDSGGSLGLRMRNKQWKLVGIVSWGEGCARSSRPGVYARVTEFVQWVNRHANDKGTTWCRRDY